MGAESQINHEMIMQRQSSIFQKTRDCNPPKIPEVLASGHQSVDLLAPDTKKPAPLSSAGFLFDRVLF